MQEWLSTVLIVLGITIVAGGIGYAGWLFTRPKVQSWKAIVYKLSNAKYDAAVDSEGKIIEGTDGLYRLVPFSFDTIVKTDKGFTLVDLGKSLNEIDADSINDYRKILPKVDRVIEVLYMGDTCTVIKSGYDKRSGMKIFKPMPFDRSVSLMRNFEIMIARFKEKTEGWLKALQWIGIVILVLGVVTIAVVYSNSATKQSDNQVKMAAYMYDYQNKMCGGQLPPELADKLPQEKKLGAQPSSG